MSDLKRCENRISAGRQMFFLVFNYFPPQTTTFPFRPESWQWAFIPPFHSGATLPSWFPSFAALDNLPRSSSMAPWEIMESSGLQSEPLCSAAKRALMEESASFHLLQPQRCVKKWMYTVGIWLSFMVFAWMLIDKNPVGQNFKQIFLTCNLGDGGSDGIF